MTDIEDLARLALRGRHTAAYHELDDADVARIRENLLAWYDVNKDSRAMPWRLPTPQVDALSDRERQEVWSLRGYQVWVSEVMLQQTQVAVVVDFYKRWMERWPTVYDLATADPEEVNKLWNGLGYYSRARRLLEGAKVVVTTFDGVLPTDPKRMQRHIPGIGPYTAGAIASIAFNRVAELVDGNVVRVLSRLRALHGDPSSSALIALHWVLARRLVHPTRPGDFNQALMDLGATVCTPANPTCTACPVRTSCRAAAEERAAAQLLVDRLRTAVTGQAAPPSPPEPAAAAAPCTLCPVAVQAPVPLDVLEKGLPVVRFPTKVSKADKVKRTETIVVAVVFFVDADGERHLLIRQRPAKGLLAGLWECPTVPAVPTDADAEAEAPTASDASGEATVQAARAAVDALLVKLGAVASPSAILARRSVGRFMHVFSHLKHDYAVEAVHVPRPSALSHRPPAGTWTGADLPADLRWLPASDATSETVTTAMQKAIDLLADFGLPATARATAKRKPAGAGEAGPAAPGTAKRARASPASKPATGQTTLRGFFRPPPPT